MKHFLFSSIPSQAVEIIHSASLSFQTDHTGDNVGFQCHKYHFNFTKLVSIGFETFRSYVHYGPLPVVVFERGM